MVEPFLARNGSLLEIKIKNWVITNIFYWQQKHIMNRSRLIEQDKVYVKFNDLGETEIVRSDSIQPGFCYRRVRNTHEGDQQRKSWLNRTEPFVDREFIIDEGQLGRLGNNNQGVVLMRLSELLRMYPKSLHPQFFPSRNSIPQRKLSSDPFLPPFATEIGLFPAEYYKSFFITQEFSPNGMYQMIINDKGRFETDVVDDWVPVYERTLEHIWGLDLDQAWQIILLKFWAKRCKGYENVKNMPPFFFIECFSNSNWKYFNLTRDGYDFLSYYTGRINMGKFVLKTKNSNLVKEAGLIPNSAGYELISLQETSPPMAANNVTNPNSANNQALVVKNSDRKWIATIRSTMVNKWSGDMSVLDKHANTLYNPTKQKLSLQRDFMITESDLLNLFSTAYIASRRDEQEKFYISDYYLLTVEPNIKKSIYLRFEAERDGWFDFCVRQADDTRVAPSTQSRMKSVEYGENYGYNDGLRFLKCKYILVKENDASSPSLTNEPNYAPPHYDTYEIEYYHGYNRGDAKFLNLAKGHYILKIKPEAHSKTTYFVVNYASNLPIKMTEYFPDKKQTSLILRESMASLIGPMTHMQKDVDRQYEEIVFANSFENIGYGFVGVRLNKSCPYSVMMEIDPTAVKNSGYLLKNQFKTITTPFSVVVRPGETSTVVLKKIFGVKYVWPPQGIQILKQV